MKPSTHRAERPGHYSGGGTWCIHCGITAGRISRAYADGTPLACVRPDTPCEHPLAARAIEVSADSLRLFTVCWACKVEAA